MAVLISLGFYALLAGVVVLLVPRRYLGLKSRRAGALAVIGGLMLMSLGGNLAGTHGNKPVAIHFTSPAAASSLTDVVATPTKDPAR